MEDETITADVEGAVDANGAVGLQELLCLGSLRWESVGGCRWKEVVYLDGLLEDLDPLLLLCMM